LLALYYLGFEFVEGRFNSTQRAGLYAGWELEFRLPGPLLIENTLMKLKLMLNIVCPARTNAWLCNLLKLVCQARLA
jgi:hypothetical protein